MLNAKLHAPLCFDQPFAATRLCLENTDLTSLATTCLRASQGTTEPLHSSRCASSTTQVDTNYIHARAHIAKMASGQTEGRSRMELRTTSTEEWFNACSETEFDDLFHQIRRTPNWQIRMPLWKKYFFCLLDVRDQLQWDIENETKLLARATKDMQKNANASILGKKIRLIRIEFEFDQGKELGLHQIQTEFALAKSPRRHYTDCPCWLYTTFSSRPDLTRALMQSIGSIANPRICLSEQR